MKKIVFIILIIILATPIFASSFQVKSANNNLDIGEKLGNVYATITESEVAELKGGTVTTDEGSTPYKQYIRLGDPSVALQSALISFTRSESDEVGDFLVINDGVTTSNAIFEYELNFESGLSSKESDEQLPGLHNRKIKIFNDDYTIVRTLVKGTNIEIELAKGSSEDFIKEQESKTFKINNKEYIIEITSVESGPPRKVKIKVNGVDLKDLQKGETAEIDTDILLGVNDMLLTQGGDSKDIVKLFLATGTLKFTDTSYADNEFTQDFSINKKKINGGFTKIKASKAGETVSINYIKYRLSPTKDFFIKPKEKLSKYIENPEGLLGSWDISYNGLESMTKNIISISPSGSKEYKLRFNNQDGSTYNLPFVSSESSFKLGDVDQDLIIVEPASDSTFSVDINDYFILTNNNDKQGKTYILKYNSIDKQNKILNFEDIAGGTKSVTYSDVSGTTIEGSAVLTVGSINSNISIEESSSNRLAIDNNGDGRFNSNAVDIITKDGGIIDLGTTNSISAPYSISLSTVQSQFEAGSSNETIGFSITSGDTLGISTTVTGVTTAQTAETIEAMSTYGTYIKIGDVNTAAPEYLTINYPSKQQFGVVFLEFGESTGIVKVDVQEVKISTCNNQIQDGDETAVDCGGSCSACPTCDDYVQNQGEEGIDCGGPCSNACQTQQIIKTSEECQGGCVYINDLGIKSCVLAEKIIDNLYCDYDGSLKSLKSNGLVCQNNYECKIGMCENGKCGKHISILALIINIIIISVLVAILVIAISLLRK